MSTDAQVIPVFPLSSDDDIDFDLLDCVPSGSGVNIIDDEELNEKSVIELSGKDSRITFYMSSPYPWFVFHVNSCGRYATINLIVKDDLCAERLIEISSKKSSILVEKKSCKLPMEIGEGWQRICFDIGDIVNRAFGARFESCLEVTISGGCKFSKIFFQNEQYSDPELPPFLRVAKIAR